MSLKTIIKNEGQLHHAYLILGDPDRNLEELKAGLSELLGLDFPTSANPDYFEQRALSWGVDDSRALKAWMTRRPFGGGLKVAVAILSSVTVEAQNALLKTLEEPAAGTHFFLLSPAGLFLPTVLSRCRVIETGAPAGKFQVEAEKFISADIPDRYLIVKGLLDSQEDGEKIGTDFLNALLISFWRRHGPARAADAESIVRAISLSAERGGSLRLLLEHLAGVLPVS